MTFAGVNYCDPDRDHRGLRLRRGLLHVAVQAVAAAIGKTKERSGEGKGSPMPFIVSIVALAVMAWVLAGGIAHLGRQVTQNGIVSALFMWLGFVITTWRSTTPSASARLAHNYRWHPLAGCARYPGRHHRRDVLS